MPSGARRAFDENAKDIDRLLELHTQTGGDARGRRFGLEVLNKSAVVLITAIWEAYCEDIAAEALEHIVNHARDANALPKEIRRMVAKELKEEKNELAIWSVADAGWRKVLSERLEKLKERRNRALNSPKTKEIDGLFLTAIGLDGASNAWSWQRMSADQARRKLDKYIELRGAIAHRGRAAENCYKNQVTDYFSHVKLLVDKTGQSVNSFVKRATGKALW
jgi:RiboL-PSP-HEPN